MQKHQQLVAKEPRDLRLRQANSTDCKLLWEWANEAGLRAAAFNTGTIAWDDHQRWFEKKLQSPNCLIFIAETMNGGPIGQIRFDWSAGIAEVDVGLVAEKRGQGYGFVLIRGGTERFFAISRISRVNAFVKLQNRASFRSFEKAGYCCLGQIQVQGSQVLQFSAERVTFAARCVSRLRHPENE